MSLHYELSPVQRLCDCGGFGRRPPNWKLCPDCDGIGRVFIEGGPLFGCKMTLAGQKPGEVVTLGNGDRGRIVRHIRRGTPTTELAVIDAFYGTEDIDPTWYPSSTGVSSVESQRPVYDMANGIRAGEVHDPLQRKTNP